MRNPGSATAGQNKPSERADLGSTVDPKQRDASNKSGAFTAPASPP